MSDELAPGATAEPTPATDTPSAEAPAAAGRVAVTLGGRRVELEPGVADEVAKLFSEQAGRLGSRLDQLARQNEQLQAQLALQQPPPPVAVAEPDDTPALELPPLPVPDRDLLTTAPDVAHRQLADAIAERERRLLAHMEAREARLREEAEALTVAAVRELGRERELERQQAQVLLQQQEDSQRRWQAFYQENADLQPYAKTVSRLFRELKSTLPATTPVEVALDRLAQEAREEIRTIRGDMPTTTPKTVSAGAPRAAAAPPPKPEPPRTLSEMILEKQQRLRQLRPAGPAARAS